MYGNAKTMPPKGFKPFLSQDGTKRVGKSKKNHSSAWNQNRPITQPLRHKPTLKKVFRFYAARNLAK
jgi:hypothetical protein